MASVVVAADRPHVGLALLDAAREVGGVEDLQIPERNEMARGVDFR